jgi:NitT/TauT family transport system substrate-binding protein
MISRRNLLITAAGATAAVLSGAAAAAERPGLTVGAVQFGTLHWLLDVIKERKLDAEEGFELSLGMVATPAAANIALLGREADIVVTDWFWVMRQRSLGGDYLFMPFSAALGGVIVPGDSPIRSVTDLKGKKIGVAGGPIDKSWLLLRAYGMKNGAGDLAATATPVFAAPPLLNEQAAAGRIDALLTFWPFAVKLEARGYRPMVSVSQIMQSLGIENPLPLVGFVFAANLPNDARGLMQGFSRAVQKGQAILAASDEEWERIRPLMKASSDEEYRMLRARYREGLLRSWNERDREAARKLFAIVKEIGGEEVTGAGVTFDPRAFWDGFVL